MAWADVDAGRMAGLVAEKDGEACTVVCLDAPAGLQLGVDLKAFALGPRFKGVKLVPPGLRMLHYRLGGSDGPARAFFFQLGNPEQSGDEKAHRVVALRWDKALEDFALVDEEDTARITAAVHRLELDANLGAYDPEHYARWQQLTQFWDERVLNVAGLRPDVLVLGAGNDHDDNNDGLDTGDDMDLTGDKVSHSSPGGVGSDYCTPHFTTLPDLARLSRQMRANGTLSDTKGAHFFKSASGAWLSPAEITALHLDPTPLLQRLIKVAYHGDYELFLGEIQLAFILFVYLASLPGLEFWKTAVHLVASSASLRQEKPSWISLFCNVLAHQVFLLPKDLFQNELLEDNFLSEALSSLLDESEASAALKPAIVDLRAALRQQYGASLLARLDAFVDEEERAFEAASLQPASTDLLAQAVEEATLADGAQEPPQPKLRKPERMAWMLP
ncbi:Protein AAR2-like [Hondaea fermentalgiana]|uniref:Protein AAR2-like n=1 Tax=Hondaea fermentalgiana TaxID=2315210 RepID=A0A2R5G972_9STRA|nr:Protein AAR2-like [Hondaea fermentalgiana]|eukprot:GBG26328.1 Protein AAR2-like [Hondaea fermentalgiana]